MRILVTISMMLIMSFAGSRQEQHQSSLLQERAYASVPQAERESLRNAVQQLISLQTAGDWEKIYEILDNQQGLSRKQFLREMQGKKLARFAPQSITFIPPEGTWMITGCGLFQPVRRNHRQGVFSSVHARKVGDGWRLTPVAIVLLNDEPRGQRPCTLE